MTEATGSASQHIFRKFGFIERVRLAYRDHRYQGKAVFAGIQEPEAALVMDRSLV